MKVQVTLVLSVTPLRAAASSTVLSGKVESAGRSANEGALKEGSAARQAIAGVPVTARQVAKRSALVSR